MPSRLQIEYIVEPDSAALARRAAEQLVEIAEQAVTKRGRARIAISGGSTPKAAFELLADPGQPFYKRMPWDKLDLYWVDERTVRRRWKEACRTLAAELGGDLPAG